MDCNKNIYKILNTWANILFIICVIDLVTIIAYPNGMYKENNYSINWFLGYKTARMVYSWALLTIVAYINFYKKEKNIVILNKKNILCCIICAYSAYKSQATGASVALILYAVLIYTLKLEKNDNKQLYQILNPKNIMVGTALIYYLVITIESNIYIQNIVVSFFNKSATLSNRTGIWKNCIDFYMQSPIFGKGIFTPSEYISISKYFLGTNAHNYILTLLISGGIVCIILYIKMVKICMQRSHKFYTKAELSLIYSIITFLFIGLTSSTLAFSPFAFLPFILLEIEKNNNIIGKEEKNEKNNNEK